MITVFSPTYNRAYIITDLYHSLCRQSYKKFEWLIIDDGSTDNTEELVDSFIDEKIIDIRYIKQSNGGKHTAINNGVHIANGELFFIVDSDDQIVDNALERIMFHYDQIKDDESFAGVCGLKAFFNGEPVGGDFSYDILDCNSLDFRYKYHAKGDMAEVFKTKILKNYPFPEYKNECFCAESIVWNKIALNYKLRYFKEKIYLCDYLPDGLSAKSFINRRRSIKTTTVYYSQLYKMPVPFFPKIKAAANYWRFAFYLKESFCIKVRQIGVSAIFLYPLGLIAYIRDRLRKSNQKRLI